MSGVTPEAQAAGEQVAALLGRLRTPLPAGEVNKLVEVALVTCRRLYGSARSGDALPLAEASLSEARRVDDHNLIFRAASACGLLSADLADIVGAVEHHVAALRVAMADENRVEMSRSWNNVGQAIVVSGNYAMAGGCYRRALALVEPIAEATYSRFAASANLADACYQTGSIEEGIRFGEHALRELTPSFRDQDPYAAVLLHRNLVRLRVAAGQVAQADWHVAEVMAIAAAAPSPRMLIAADITRATHELALGRADVALTRLDQVLGRAREVPATLRDALVCVIRAEEAAGNSARALMRLEELSDHVYSHAIDRARELLSVASLRDEVVPGVGQQAEHDRARLIAKLSPPAPPEGWKALQRLAASASLRHDPTGWHGRRVGALTKALAAAMGVAPLQAHEIGLAAELHDVGMLSVPAAILSKPAKLNPSESSIVERHVEAGAEMLRDDRHPMVFLAREIARYHHARWDGTGYPERVAGRSIPPAARMCAVADAYDAMVCGIGQGPRRSMSAALDELRRAAGSQFDPEVVSCFDVMVRAELEDRGWDLETGPGMEDFQELVLSLKEDRGFV